MRLAALMVVGSAIASVAAARAEDWPQWRGANRDGVWREQGVFEKFPGEQLDIVWRAPISSGYSGPTVADGRVFVMDRVDAPKQIERVLAFDERTGKPLWTHKYDCVYSGVGYVAGPRASVTVDDGRAFSIGTMGNLFALDAKTGNVLWQKDCLRDYKIRMPMWGIAGSPLVYKDLVIVHIGGDDGACLVAFDKKTGEEKWRALEDDASYSSPILIEQAGETVLVCWTGEHVAGLDPATGKVHWQHPFDVSRMVISIATPVLEQNQLFVSSFYDGSLMLKLDPDRMGVEQVWRRKGPDERKTESLHAMIGTPYLQGDYVYGVDSYGELRCLDGKTGDRIWESDKAVPRERWATIHMVRNGENIWMFNDRGELIISRLSPEGFREISRTKLIDPTTEQLRRGDGVCWSHPAYANKHVFARNDKEIVCANLSAE